MESAVRSGIAVTERQSAGRRLDAASRMPLLNWMIFTGLSLFAFVLLWRFGLIRQMVLADRTYISSLIVLLYIGTSLHCLRRTIAVSREGDAAHRAAQLVAGGWRAVALVGDAVDPVGVDALPEGVIGSYIRELAVQAGRRSGRPPDRTLLLRSLAARLRGSNQLGALASDTLMKLGLVGTIIGFIMMLAPIAGLDTGDRGAIRSSMNLMSDGMAVAMYTTLAGLVGSILVTIQYTMLESATARLFAFAVDLVEIHVVAALERPPDAPR